MTKEEQTISNLKKLKSFHNGSYGADIDRAIKAIEQESSNDMVSRGVFEQVMWERDVAIEQLKDLGYELGEKPKTGHWILDDDKEHGRCSECGCKEDLVDGHSSYKWCSNCGAKMFEPQESEG